MIYDVDKNPDGVDKKVRDQKKREQSGKFYSIDSKMKIFVKRGENAKERIEKFKRQIEERKNRIKIEPKNK